MIKFMFFDYREIEDANGFVRKLNRPVKHKANPLFVADQPWENGNMQLYGSVVRPPGGPFQLWYSVWTDPKKPFEIAMCYAQSDDGVHWQRPLLEKVKIKGQPTNIVMNNQAHGPAVIYDHREPLPARRYKLVMGAAPTHCVLAYASPDGINWKHLTPGRPLLPTGPDCPMGFLRANDGRYVIYHRVWGYGRRVFRSESFDLIQPSGEARLVMEPDAGDPPQLQFYGMGSTAYGPYELGTLWVYHTDHDDPQKMRGYQEAELTYTRSGYAWHRAAQGTTFIPHAEKSWEKGNLQCASAPVFLEDEIRYYYMGTTAFHAIHWELMPQTAGIGMAALKPDRFVGLHAGTKPATLTTYRFAPVGENLSVNAVVGRRGEIRAELRDANWKAIKGFTLADCAPIGPGDWLGHAIQWKGGAWPKLEKDKSVRLLLKATDAAVYSIFQTEPGEKPVYHQFRSPLG